MELKEFIKTAIADIVKGTRDAGEELKGDVLLCYHTDGAYNGYPSISYKHNMKERQAPITVVEFKVRVEVEERSATERGVKAGVLNVVGGKMQGEISNSSIATNEISFAVPLAWVRKDR